MGFDPVVVADEAFQFVLPVGEGFKMGLIMPHFHDGPYDPFCFPVGLGPSHPW